MPLVHGYSKSSIAKNIRTEVRHGKPVRQATAIAYREAKAAARKAHKHPAYLYRRK